MQVLYPYPRARGEMSEKTESAVGQQQPANLGGLARSVPNGAAEARTSPPVAQKGVSGANKRGSALVEVIRREMMARFSDRLSMKKIADCSWAVAMTIAPLNRPPARSKSAARGIFQRPPRSGVWWMSYLDAEGRRHREKVGERYAALDALRRRRLEVNEGRFVPPRGGARLTFRDLATATVRPSQRYHVTHTARLVRRGHPTFLLCSATYCRHTDNLRWLRARGSPRFDSVQLHSGHANNLLISENRFHAVPRSVTQGAGRRTRRVA
jgi:hypothetical protein